MTILLIATIRRINHARSLGGDMNKKPDAFLMLVLVFSVGTLLTAAAQALV